MLVASLHPGNLGLCWLVSLFCRIKVRDVHPTCRRFLSGRLTPLRVGDCLDVDEVHCFRSKALRLWERLLPGIPEGSWRLRIDHRDLECSGKAKQELAEEFEGLLLLGEVQRRGCEATQALVIESARMRYLRGLRGAAEIPWPRTAPVLSGLNSVCDTLFLHGVTLARAGRLAVTLAFGIAQRGLTRRPALQPGASCLYHAMNPNEMSLSRENRCALWIMDGERVKPQDVIFVMPGGIDAKTRRALRNSGYLVLTLRELVSRMPAASLRRTLTALLGFVWAYPAHAMRQLPSALTASYAPSILTWKPIVDHLKPRSYVVNLGNLSVEDPAILYMNAVGVRTVMYCYAANSYLFASHRCGCDFRAALFSHILASTVVVWHEHFKQFLESHPQQGVAVRVIGPLMAGDERVIGRGKEELRQACGIGPRDGTQGLRVITAFDVAALAKGWQPPSASTFHLNPYTEEYVTAFLRDMVRLVHERQDILLVYKPQRDLAKAKFAPSEDCAGLVRALQAHPRVVMVKDTINPWVPIAVADLCIAMPFTSPALAAMHYGKPAIYHDPLDRCQWHRYQSLEGNAITHSYEALRAKVDAWMVGCGSPLAGGGPWRAEVLPYVGSDPGTNSTEAFQAMIVPQKFRFAKFLSTESAYVKTAMWTESAKSGVVVK